MNDITEILLSVANKQQHKHNGKTLLIDGIEYTVYITYDSFMLSPVNPELDLMKFLTIIPFGAQNSEEFRNKYKNIKVIA
jgi:hypothetical protein